MPERLMNWAKTSAPKITMNRVAVVRAASASVDIHSSSVRRCPRRSEITAAPKAPMPAASVGVKMPP